MPARKPTRRPAAKMIEEPAGDGIVIRIAERALDNPAMSGGLLVMGLTAVAIVSNAMFLQNARHPDPLFMTRPAPAIAERPAAAVPIPRPRLEPAAGVAHASAPAAVPPAIVAEDAVPADKATIAAIQRALLSRGVYQGTVDGRMGSRTKAAILAYQKAEGLKATGAPSAALLDHLRTAAVKPVTMPRQPAPAKLPPAPVGPAASAAPAMPPVVPVAAVEKPAAVPAPQPIAAMPAPAASADPIGAVAAPEAEDLPAQPAMQQQAAVEPAAPAAPAIAAPSDAAVAAARRTIAVQNALNLSGYGPVPADGMLNDDTVNAIRRFELDNGMPITGRIGDGLINRLVAVGAITPG